MSGTFSPLKVIVNPPGVQAGMPGETLEIHVVVMNQGDQNAIIDVFLDEAFQVLTRLSIAPCERVALGPQQSIEVSFQVPIPIDTLPGTYDYNLIVDAPQHYPADTPIQFPQQVKVLLKEQTIIREFDPTFSLQPTSNAGHPLVFQSGSPLQIAISVANRSTRVDSFRLTCPDLEDNWFTIRYAAVGLPTVGLATGGTRLELNPTTSGQILLDFHPPLDVFAGSYSFTLRLHSENSPNIVMLDLAYVQIPPIYNLGIKLNTILGQIRRSSGKYELELNNLGNTVRQVSFSAKMQAEEELCNYQFTPDRAKLLPSKSTVVDLTVQPRSWWKQPLSGTGLYLNFQVDLADTDQLPINDSLPAQTLVWLPRPWWQFLLLVLFILGLVGSLGLIAWLLFYPHPLSIENFGTESRKIDEGDRVLLNWDIHNSAKIGSLKLVTKGPVPNERELKITDLVGDGESEKTPCTQQNKVLACRNFKTEVKEPGKYTFELKVLDDSNKTIATKITEEVEITARPEPEIKEVKLNKSTYTSGEKILLDWFVQSPEKLVSIQIAAKAEDGKIASQQTIDREQAIKENSCKIEPKKMQLVCQGIPLNITQAGKYQVELTPISKSKKAATTPPQPIKIEVLPKTLKITSFKLNGNETESIVVREGENLTLSWQVDGEENIQIELVPFGTVARSGTKQIQVTPALPAQISLTVTDKYGQKATKGFSIKVEANNGLPSTTPTDPNLNQPSPTSPTLPVPGQSKPSPKPPKDMSI
jgi:hypothetical protein